MAENKARSLERQAKTVMTGHGMLAVRSLEMTDFATECRALKEQA